VPALNAPPPPAPLRQVIALLGAECTGKSTLATQLRDHLSGQGHSVALVREYLREFCERRGRTPRRDEQAFIAAEQALRIEQAAARHDWVIADTTALMPAIYSDFVFQDPSLYALALQAQTHYAAHLLTAIDLPWSADGHQRDGAHVREPVDQLIRRALSGRGLTYSVVCGRGAARLNNALASLPPAAVSPASEPGRSAVRWTATCERCGDSACERHFLPR
jgi:nicotinamide riboside kinase